MLHNQMKKGHLIVQHLQLRGFYSVVVITIVAQKQFHKEEKDSNYKKI